MFKSLAFQTDLVTGRSASKGVAPEDRCLRAGIWVLSCLPLLPNSAYARRVRLWHKATGNDGLRTMQPDCQYQPLDGHYPSPDCQHLPCQGLPHSCRLVIRGYYAVGSSAMHMF